MNQLVPNVVGGVLAGLVVLLLSALWGEAQRRWKRRQFRQVFGHGAFSSAFALIYADLELPDRDSEKRFRYRKPNSPSVFSMSQPVAISEVKAANYLANAFGRFAGVAPSLRSDAETMAVLDLDFVSLGGPESNRKTGDCQTNSANRLAEFDQKNNQFVRVSDGSPLVPLEGDFDYGLILKVRPAQFPKRVWIACAGRGEWGTSGAAWFLANKWSDLRKHATDKPFAAVVRVRPGQDQSAELVYLDPNGPQDA